MMQLLVLYPSHIRLCFNNSSITQVAYEITFRGTFDIPLLLLEYILKTQYLKGENVSLLTHH